MRSRLALTCLLVAVAAACSSVGPHGLTDPSPVPEAPERPAELTPPAPTPMAAPALPEQPARGAAPPSPSPTWSTSRSATTRSPAPPTSRRCPRRPTSAAPGPPTTHASTCRPTSRRTQQSALGGQFDYQQTSYGPTVDLSWLVLDLGGRAADAEEARLALLAADWTHTATVQNVILGVQQTFVAVPQREGPARGGAAPA